MIKSSIQILAETEFFIILIKPTAVSSHNQSPSVAEYLTLNKKPLHFVNRLDQDTSGLMVIAKDPEIHEELAEALEHGQKIYRALLRGPWVKPQTTDIHWKWDISDKAEGRQNPQGIKADRQNAESIVNIVRTSKHFTEATIEILTGRQHQIRKHAAIAEFPIVGDSRYNDKKYNDKIAERYQVKRMHLHAEKLEFNFKNKDFSYESKYSLGVFFA